MLNKEEDLLLKFCAIVKPERISQMKIEEKKALMHTICHQWSLMNEVDINVFLQTSFDNKKMEKIKNHIYEYFLNKNFNVNNLGKSFYQYNYLGAIDGKEQMQLGNVYESLQTVQKFINSLDYEAATPLYFIFKEFDIETIKEGFLPQKELSLDLKDNIYDRLLVDKNNDFVPAFNWLNKTTLPLNNVNISNYEYSSCKDAAIIVDYVENKISNEDYKKTIESNEVKAEFIAACVKEGKVTHPLLGKHIIKDCSFDYIKMRVQNSVYYSGYVDMEFLSLLSKLCLLTDFDVSRKKDLLSVFAPFKDVTVFNKSLIRIIKGKSFYAKDAWKFDNYCINYMQNVFSILGNEETQKLIGGIIKLSHDFCDKASDMSKISKLHEEKLLFMYLLQQKMVFSLGFLLKNGYQPHVLEIDQLSKTRKIEKIINAEFPELFKKNEISFEEEFKIILGINSKTGLKQLEDVCSERRQDVLSLLHQGKDKDLFIDYYPGSKVDNVQFSTVSIVPKLIGDKKLDKLCILLKNGLQLNEKEAALLYLPLDTNTRFCENDYTENMHILFDYIKKLPVEFKKELFRNIMQEKCMFLKMNNDMSESLMSESIDLVKELTREVMPLLSGREKQEVMLNMIFNSFSVFLMNNDILSKHDNDMFIRYSGKSDVVKYLATLLEVIGNAAENFDKFLLKETYTVTGNYLKENNNKEAMSECRQTIENAKIKSNIKEEFLSYIEKQELLLEFDNMHSIKHAVKKRI